jgi:hypothetical protein
MLRRRTAISENPIAKIAVPGGETPGTLFNIVRTT